MKENKNAMSRRHVYQMTQESMAEMEGCVSVWKEEEGRCQGEREKNLLANERGQRQRTSLLCFILSPIK